MDHKHMTKAVQMTPARNGVPQHPRKIGPAEAKVHRRAGVLFADMEIRHRNDYAALAEKLSAEAAAARARDEKGKAK